MIRTRERLKRLLGIKSLNKEAIGKASPPYGAAQGMAEGLSKLMCRYICLDCDYTNSEYVSKEEYVEAKPCPKCGGKYIDLWKSELYRNGHNVKPLNKTNSSTGNVGNVIIMSDTCGSYSCDSASDVGCSND